MTTTKTIEWTMGNGWNAIVTVAHLTSEKVNADGHVVDVKCDKINTMLKIDAAKIVERDFYLTTNVTDAAKKAGAFATTDTIKGVIGVSEDVYNQISAAIKSFEAPKKEVKEIKRGFGWCDKCESYCFGDCEA